MFLPKGFGAHRSGLKVLFEEGCILTDAAEGTFAHHVLKFLRKTKIMYFQETALILEGQSGGNKTQLLFQPLQRIRLLVSSMKQMAQCLRPAGSWERRFVAYRLPPPVDSQVELKAMWAHAGWNPDDTWAEWTRLLPVALVKHQHGLSVQQSWAQASADFPEWKLARQAVTLLLAFAASSAITERTLKELSRQETAQRARMLNSTEEDILLAWQAPKEEQVAHRTTDSFGNKSLRPKNKYLPLLLKDYILKFGNRKCQRAPKQRRDAGLKKDPALLQQQREARGGAVPEADTGHDLSHMLSDVFFIGKASAP